jgi:hypothetical protein
VPTIVGANDAIAEAFNLYRPNAEDDAESEALANARLIAAAPEMLAALQSLTHPMASDEDLQNALAVIAKAEGRDS